jgi:hypothetical protein
MRARYPVSPASPKWKANAVNDLLTNKVWD